MGLGERFRRLWHRAHGPEIVFALVLFAALMAVAFFAVFMEDWLYRHGKP